MISRRFIILSRKGGSGGPQKYPLRSYGFLAMASTDNFNTNNINLELALSDDNRIYGNIKFYEGRYTTSLAISGSDYAYAMIFAIPQVDFSNGFGSFDDVLPEKWFKLPSGYGSNDIYWLRFKKLGYSRISFGSRYCDRFDPSLVSSEKYAFYGVELSADGVNPLLRLLSEGNTIYTADMQGNFILDRR